jgi:uncharacterized membrane protein
MGIIVLLGILAFAYIGYNDNLRTSSEWIPISEESSARETVTIGYANGDISHEEYERLKTDLGY